MRVLHVIPSLSPACGGPSFALPAMAKALSAAGLRVDIVATDDDGPGRRMQNQAPGMPVQFEGYRVFYFPKQTEFYKASLPLLYWLMKHVDDYDAVHVHALFSFSSLAASWACLLKQVPYIIRPLGVLGWGMQHRRRLLKAFSFRLLDKPVVDRAAAVHYTSSQEQDEAVHLCLRCRPVVIPLGFDLAPFQSLPSSQAFLARHPEAAGKKVVLYLSRLDPKKNVAALLEAFAILRRDDVVLVIAGSGDPGHMAHLQEHSAQLGIREKVLWTGHIEGEMKLSALAAASLYVLPSLAENFGIALLEAMAAARACLSTPGVALAAEAAKEEAVLLATADPPSLAGAMRSVLDDPALAGSLGSRAASFVRSRYSSDAMAASLAGLYQSCLASPSTQS